jgi:hypothetical protein
MIARKEGAIVNVVAVNAFFQPDGLVIDYGAAKAAFAECLESALPGARLAGDPHQLRLARSGRDRLLAREQRRRGHGRPRNRRRPGGVRERAIAGIRSGRFSTQRRWQHS